MNRSQLKIQDRRIRLISSGFIQHIKTQLITLTIMPVNLNSKGNYKIYQVWFHLVHQNIKAQLETFPIMPFNPEHRKGKKNKIDNLMVSISQVFNGSMVNIFNLLQQILSNRWTQFKLLTVTILYQSSFQQNDVTTLMILIFLPFSNLFKWVSQLIYIKELLMIETQLQSIKMYIYLDKSINISYSRNIIWYKWLQFVI